jgi:hypothetical protein
MHGVEYVQPPQAMAELRNKALLRTGGRVSAAACDRKS